LPFLGHHKERSSSEDFFSIRQGAHSTKIQQFVNKFSGNQQLLGIHDGIAMDIGSGRHQEVYPASVF
jgi:hypothetical protein